MDHGRRQHLYLTYRARLRLKEPAVDGQIDDIVLATERRSVAALRLLRWSAATLAYFLLLRYRIVHTDVPVIITAMLTLGLPLGLYALVRTLHSLFDTIAPPGVPCLRVHLHFTGIEGGFVPERACVLHDGSTGQASLSPTVEALTKKFGIRVTVLRTDAPIDKHRTTTCNC